MLGIGLLTVGCSTTQSAADEGTMLASSGFEQRTADTPQKQAMLARLPPHTLVQRHWNGKVIYAYAGPPACNCAYVGDEAAFARFQKNAQNQQQSLPVREDASFDPEPWGMTGWRS